MMKKSSRNILMKKKMMMSKIAFWMTRPLNEIISILFNYIIV